MKKKSKQICRYFSFGYDNLAVLKEYLEQMAAQGWMFVEYTGLRLVFEPCEARKLNFAVEIFDKASQYATFCNEENQEYIEYCERAGWTYISSCGNLQFFYSEDMELTPIETDDRMKWESIWHANRANRISMGVILPACAILQLFTPLVLNPMSLLISYVSFASLCCWTGLLANSIVYWFRTLLWRRRCLKSIEEGRGILLQKHLTAKQGYILLAGILGIWSGGGILSAVVTGDGSSTMLCIISLFGIMILPLVFGIRKLAVRLKLSPSMHLFLQVALGVGLSSVFMVAIIFMLASFSLWEHHSHDTWKFTAPDAGDVSVTVQIDELPFFFDSEGHLTEQPRTAEGRKDSGYSTHREFPERFLVSHDIGEQILIWETLSGKKKKTFTNMFPTEGIYAHYELYQSHFGRLIDKIYRWGEQEKRAYACLVYPFEEAERQDVAGEDAETEVYLYINEDEEDSEYAYLFRRKHSILKLELSRELPEETLERLCQTLP